MRYRFILNPAAQNGRAGRRRAALEGALTARGVAFSVVETEAPGHAEALACASAADHDVVVAVGGDGTIQEVARGLLGTGATFGALPLGTGNDFAHAMGMPDGLDAAVGALLDAPVRTLDLGRVRWEERADGGRLVRHEAVFSNCLGAGFDALAALSARKYKALGGRTAYLAGVLKALWTFRRPLVEVEVLASQVGAPVLAGVDDAGADEAPFGLSEGAGARVYAGPLLFVDVGNGYSVGGGFLLTPDAVPDDGLLDVCVVAHATTRRILRLLPSAFKGGHVGEPEVTMGRARRFVIRSSTPLPVHADGEVIALGARTLDVEVLAGALRALVPQVRSARGAA